MGSSPGAGAVQPLGSGAEVRTAERLAPPSSIGYIGAGNMGAR